MSKRSILVLGGGISGMTTAYKLKQLSPSLNITIYEKNSVLGGWVQSNLVDGKYLVEYGPKSIRLNDSVSSVNTLNFIKELDLLESASFISKLDVVSNNRLIYYNNKMMKLPQTLLEFSRIWENYELKSNLLKGVLSEHFKQNITKDVCVYDFFKHRFNEYIADILITSLTNGIYAGNTKELSIEACFNSMFKMQSNTNSSIIKSILLSKNSNRNLDEIVKKNKMYTFENGMNQIIKRLEQKIKSNVDIKKNVEINKIEVLDKINVVFKDKSVSRFDHVISAINLKDIGSLIDGTNKPLGLFTEKNVDVCVVCFNYKENTIKEDAFGYLLPSVSKDNLVLGVVFDSKVFAKQHNNVRYDQLTVMLGGHLFKDGHCSFGEDYIVALAAEHVEKVLKISKTDITGFSVRINRNCIPQYEVNHYGKMRNLHNFIKNEFNGKISVVGASYTGVSINDCISNALNLSSKINNKFSHKENSMVVTGLEDFGQ